MQPRFEKAIELHKRHSRIYFSEVRENDDELVVSVRQTRAPNGIYLDRKELEEVARDLYALKPDFKKRLIVNAAPYVEAPSEIVTPEWIKDQMTKYKFGLKGLVEATGVSKSDLSAMINGHKEMGIRTKGLFYYFFKSLGEDAADQIQELRDGMEELRDQLAKKDMQIKQLKQDYELKYNPVLKKAAMMRNKNRATKASDKAQKRKDLRKGPGSKRSSL